MREFQEEVIKQAVKLGCVKKDLAGVGGVRRDGVAMSGGDGSDTESWKEEELKTKIDERCCH